MPKSERKANARKAVRKMKAVQNVSQPFVPKWNKIGDIPTEILQTVDKQSKKDQELIFRLLHEAHKF